MNKQKPPTLSLRLSVEHLALIDSLAKQLGLTRSAIIRLALLEFAGKLKGKGQSI